MAFEGAPIKPKKKATLIAAQHITFTLIRCTGIRPAHCCVFKEQLAHSISEKPHQEKVLHFYPVN